MKRANSEKDALQEKFGQAYMQIKEMATKTSGSFFRDYSFKDFHLSRQ